MNIFSSTNSSSRRFSGRFGARQTVLDTASARQSRILIGLALSFFAFCIPSIAEAETVVVMMKTGMQSPKLTKRLRKDLIDAGHKAFIVAATLDDSALMMGCDPRDDECVDLVIDAAGAHAAVIISPKAQTLMVRRTGKTERTKVESGKGQDAWSAVLADAFDIEQEAEVVPEVEEVAPTDTPPMRKDVVRAVEPAEPVTTDSSLSSLQLGSWIAIGGGVVAASGGLIFHTLASDAQGEVDAHPVDTAEDLLALRTLESDGARYRRNGNVLVVAGGAMVVTGVVLLLVDRRSEGESSGPLVTPMVGPGAAGVRLSWTR